MKILAKRAIFLVLSKVEPICHHFWPPQEKHLEKPTSAPPGKNLSDAHTHKHVKLHHVCKNGVVLHQGLQTFLSKGHISYYRTFRGTDVLRNAVVLGCYILPINKILVIFFHHLIKWLRGPDGMASRAAFVPRAVVWRPLHYTIWQHCSTTPVR